MSPTEPDRDAWFQDADGFPRPSWTHFEKWLLTVVGPGQVHWAWESLTEDWLRRIERARGGNLCFAASKYFHLLSPHSPRECERMLEEGERIYGRIADALGDVILPPFGKIVVLRFREPDEYYQYISFFHPEDREHPMSGGMCITEGFPHILCLVETFEQFCTTFAHELTHLLVAHLPLPAWVNEGLATGFEAEIGYSHLPNAENARKQRAYWNEENIQSFWSGESYHNAGEAFELSYGLAAILFDVIYKELQPPPQAFRAFIQHADRADGGAAAAARHLRAEPGELLEVFLGPRNWNPRPGRWPTPTDPS